MKLTDFTEGQTVECRYPILSRDNKKTLMKMGETATVACVVPPDQWNSNGYIELRLERRHYPIWFSPDCMRGEIFSVGAAQGATTE